MRYRMRARVEIEECEEDEGQDQIGEEDVLEALDGAFELTNGAVRIRFRLARTREAGLTIFDARGRLVRALPPVGGGGAHSVTWDRRDTSGALASRGMYFVRLRADGLAATRKLVLLHQGAR